MKGCCRGGSRTVPTLAPPTGARRRRPAPLPLALLLALSLLAGCALGAPSAPPTPAAPDSIPDIGPAPSRTARPTPRGEQALTIAGPATLQPLDPARARDVARAFLARQLFRGLVRLDAGLTPVPDLAERIVVSADGLVYEFTLRDGAVFHNSRPIEAAAVKYSLERATDPATAGGRGSLPGATYLSDIDGARDKLAGRARDLRGVVVVDARTVTIRLDTPAAPFLMKLSHPAAAIVDEEAVRAAPGDGPAAWWRGANGSGPFRLEGVASDRLTLRAFDRFWAGAPTLRTVMVLLGAAANAPLNLYEGGKIDYTRVPLASVDRFLVASSPLRAELGVTPSLSLTYIGFNANQPPFDDPAVRRAFVQALDRDKIARVSEGGKVVKAEGIVPPGMPGGPWAGQVPAYDLPAARAGLAASRYGGPGGLPRTSVYGNSGSLPTTMAAVYERDLGVPVEVIGVDWPDYLAGLDARAYPAFELTWTADYPDPENFLAVLFASDSGENHLGYANPAVDRLLAEAGGERDRARRTALYREAQARILDDAALIPVYHAIDYTLVKPHLRGLAVTPMGILDLDGVWIER